MSDVRLEAGLDLNVTGVQKGAAQAVSSLESVQAEIIETEKVMKTGLGRAPLAPLTTGTQTLASSLGSLKIAGTNAGNALSTGITRTTGATRSLQIGIAQLSGEIPNFFQSARIGFMAIGNNIQPISLAIKGLRAEGKSTSEIFKTVTASFLGWQTLLLVGVGLISRYGGELIDMATGAKDANEKAEALKKTQDELDKAFSRGVQSVADNISKVQSLVAVMSDESVAQDVRISKYNQLIAMYPQLAGIIDGQKDKLGALAIVINTDLIPALRNQAIAQGFAAQTQEQGAKMAELIAKQGTLFDRAVAARRAYNNRTKSATGIFNVVQTELENKRLKEASDAATKAYIDNLRAVQGLRDGMDNLFSSQIKYQNEVDKSILGTQTYKQQLEEQLKTAKAVRDNIADASSPAFAKQTEIIEGLSAKLRVYNDTTADTPKKVKPTTDALVTLSQAFEKIDRDALNHIIHFSDVTVKKLAALKTAIESIGDKGGDVTSLLDLARHFETQLSDKSITSIKLPAIKFETPKLSKDAHMLPVQEMTDHIDKELNQLITNISQSGIGNLADSIGAALGAGSDVKTFTAIFDGFKSSLGSAIQDFGKWVIAQAITIKTLKDTIKTWIVANPALAIGAGVALVALGAAMKASMSNPGTNFNGTTSSGGSFSGNIGGGVSSPRYAGAAASSPNGNMNAAMQSAFAGIQFDAVQFKIDGPDLVASMKRTQSLQNA